MTSGNTAFTDEVLGISSRLLSSGSNAGFFNFFAGFFALDLGELRLHRRSTWHILTINLIERWWYKADVNVGERALIAPHAPANILEEPTSLVCPRGAGALGRDGHAWASENQFEPNGLREKGCGTERQRSCNEKCPGNIAAMSGAF